MDDPAISGPLAKLTAREREVLDLIGSIGHSKGVAAKLNLSGRTIEHHLASARQKLGCETTVQAIHLYRSMTSSERSVEMAETERAPRVHVEPGLPAGRRRNLTWFFGVPALTLVVVAFWLLLGKEPPSTESKAGVETVPVWDDFDHGVLHDWTHRPGVGRVSATESVGKLRYTLTGKSGRTQGSAPYYLYRTFTGKYWEMEFKAKFKLPYLQHGRQFHVWIVFGDDPFDFSRGFTWWVTHDSPGSETPKHAQLCATAADPGRQDTRVQTIPSEKQEPVTVVMSRNGNVVSIEYVLPDGKRAGHLETGLSELPEVQSIVVYGQAYDNDAHPTGIGGWIDLEYFHGRAMAPKDP